MILATLKRALESALVLLAALLFYAMPVDQARAAITFQSAGAVSDSAVTSIAPPYPAAVAAGDLLILIIGMKHSAGITGGSVTTPEGWTLITSLVGAGGYAAAPTGDTGNTNVFAYYKVAEGNETGSLRVRLTTINSAWSQMYRFTNATRDWSVAGTTGPDATGDAAVSITMSANPGVTVGDHILGAMVIPTDFTTPAQFSAEAFSQTGVTFGAVTELSEPDSTLGNDIGGFVVRSSVTSGTGSAAPVMTATAAVTFTNVRGPGIFIRVRATGPITYQSAGALDYIGATLATSVCPAHPAVVVAGDLLVTIIGMKHSGAGITGGSVTTPSGWTAISGGSLIGAGGYVAAPTADTGNTNVFSFYRVATGTEVTERCFALTTNNVSWAQMYRFSSTTQSWQLAGTTGPDATGNAAVSITMSANPGVTVGDHILGAMVIPTDVQTPAQFSAEAFSQTGVTFGAVTEVSEPDSTTGNDIGGFVVRSSVTTGTGTAAPVMTATAGGTTTNVRGPGVFIRIREQPPAFTQAAFRFYEDGTESGSAAIANQDTNVSRNVAGGNSNLQLRLRVQETNAGTGAATDDYQLQYSKNAGAFANVTGASSNVLGFNSASLSDGGATTNRLGAGSGSFVAGVVAEDGLADNHQITASNYTEYLFSLTLVSADLANSDMLDFRLLRNGATIAAYSVTPSITVTKVTPGSFNAVEVGTAVNGVIQTKIAGTGFSLDVVAISGGVQQVAFTDPVTVELLGNIATGVSTDAQNCPTSFALQQAVSPDPTVSAGRVTVAFAAVSNAWRDVRVRVRWPTTSPSVTWCSSDNFAIRPASLTVTAHDATWATAGTTRPLANTGASGGTVHKAATAASPLPFTLRATPLPATATNYDGSPTAVTGFPACGTLCTNVGVLSFTGGSWTAAGSGVRENATANYSEAGTFNLQLEDTSYASVDAGDGSSAATRTVPATATVEIGRFVPSHFVVATNNTPQFKTFNNAGCGSRSFTYMGQPFGYVTAPQVLVTAKNLAGVTTTNYGNTLWKIAAAAPTKDCTTDPNICTITAGDVTQVYTYSTVPAVTPNWDDAQVSVLAPTINPLNDGTGTVAGNAADVLAFKRNPATPQALFSASITLAESVKDVSESGNCGVAGAGACDITSTAAAQFNPVAFDSGNEFRYGRLKLFNAYGSDLLPLRVPVRAEHFNGTTWTINTADSCTVLTLGALAIGNVTKPAGSNLAFSTPPAGVTGSPSATLTSGTTSLAITPSVKGVGSADLILNLGGAIGMTSCVTLSGPVGGGAPTPTLEFLAGNWCGAAYDKAPVTRIKFGSPKAPYIYLRERY